MKGIILFNSDCKDTQNFSSVFSLDGKVGKRSSRRVFSPTYSYDICKGVDKFFSMGTRS